MAERVPVVERARRYLGKMGPAVSGAGGHTHTLLCARALVRGFLLSHSEALALLEEWNAGNDEKWSTHELEHKLRSAMNGPGENGYLLKGGDVPPEGNKPEVQKAAPMPRPKVVYDPELLRRLAGGLIDEVDLVWLANRSEVDPAGVSAAGFLRRLYRADAGEKVVVFSEYKSQGQAVWPDEEIPTAGPDGVWFLAQPVDGKMRPNPRLRKMSRRSEESVLAWRWLVLESDDAPVKLWLAALAKTVPRIAAITTSGGRSVHALVRVDAPTKGKWDEIKKRLLNLVAAGADPGALSAVRLTRLPGCLRGGREQKLLYFAPSAPAMTIEQILCRRDVLAHWREVVVRWGEEGEPVEGRDRMLAGVRHYARFDSFLNDALKALTGISE